MSTTELFEKIQNLPADKQKEVEVLVFELTQQLKGISNDTLNFKFSDKDGFLTHLPIERKGKSDKKLPRKFGDLKGFVTYMSDDFDKPMDEFKDYM